MSKKTVEESRTGGGLSHSLPPAPKERVDFLHCTRIMCRVGSPEYALPRGFRMLLASPFPDLRFQVHYFVGEKRVGSLFRYGRGWLKPSGLFNFLGLFMILVVDDEPLVLNFLSLCVRQMGYTPVESHSPIHALQKFEHTGPFKLLVTNIHMQGMTGFQLAEAVRKKEPHLPILFVSAQLQEPNEVSAWMERGRVLFLPKPFALEDLRLKMKVLLNPSKIGLPTGWETES